MLPKKILLLTAFLYLGLSNFAYAQKLPNVQQGSLPAPINIKIDGKPTEWNDQFKAYNHATDLSYAMANDDDNLYLVVQESDVGVLLRILRKGITLSVKHENLKEVSFTFPANDIKASFKLTDKKNAIKDTTANEANSLMLRNNKLLDDSCKFIRVEGIPGVDTLISVYNRVGIKIRGQFDNQKIYTCEFSIKLKLLNVSVNDKVNLSYTIRVNGYKTPALTILPPPNPTPDQQATFERMQQLMNKLNAPTFFKGEYILVRKQ